MTKLYTIFLVLTIVLVVRITGDPPNLPDAVSSRSALLEVGQCKRGTFIEKGKWTDFLQQLKANTEMKDVLDILGNSVTKAIRICSTKSTPFDDLEIKSGMSYICGTPGAINNLYSLYATSWKFQGDETAEMKENAPLEIKISYKYSGGINVQYVKSYVKLPMAHDLTGKLFVEFKEFNIDLTLTADSKTTIIDKLSKQQCFLHIKNFEGSLTGPIHSMLYVNHKKTYKLHQEKINSMLMTKIDEIKELLLKKVKAGFYEGLVNSGEWVCLDDHVKEVIDEKLTSTRKEISSKDFTEYCKNDSH